MSIWYRMLSVILPLGILMGGTGVLITLSKDPKRFPLHAIEVQGDVKHLDTVELQKVVSQHMKQGFFWLNVNAVHQSIVALPWVAAAEVRRVWPDRVRISVEEQVPQALWNEMGVLSTKGIIFYPDLGSLPENVPRFNGPEARASEMLQQYFAFLEMLSPLRLSISELNLSPDGTWRISLDNGIAIILGKAALNERMGRFVLAYPSSLLGRRGQIAYLDFRYTNGFAIGWKAQEKAPLANPRESKDAKI